MESTLPGLGPEERSASEPAERRINLLLSLRRHKLLVILILLAVGGAAYPILQRLRLPVYRTEAILLISPVAKTLGEERSAELPRYDEFVKQQRLLVAREDVTLDALDRLGERRSLWQGRGESNREAALRLSRALIVEQIEETLYISVGIEAPRPEGLAEVVGVVVDAYLARVRGQIYYGVDDQLAVLTKRMADLQEELDSKSGLLARRTRELGAVGHAPGTPNPALLEAERALNEARVRRIQAEARLLALAEKHEVLKRLDPTLEVLDIVGASPELSGYRSILQARKNELKGKLLGLTAEHEGRRALEAAIADIDAELGRAEKAMLELARSSVVGRGNARMAEERLNLQAEVDQAKRYEQILVAENGSLLEKMVRHGGEAQMLLTEVERLRRQLAAAQDRADAMRLETQAQGYVHVVAAATPPEAPRAPKLLKWITLFVLGALFLAVAVPVLVDARDGRVRSPEDVEGSVLWLPVRKRRTESFVRDQARRLAQTLERERHMNRQVRIVFAAVRSERESSWLVLDVARELGAIGVPALAVEANTLKPDPRFAGPNGHAGLAAVLSGRAPIDHAIIPAEGDLPDRIPAGETDGRIRLAGSGNVGEMLGQMAPRYEFVLIDAPPLLLSADADLVAGSGDGVVLVVEVDRTLREDVKRAREILRQVGTPVILTVVNRLRSRPGLEYYMRLVREHESAARARA